MIVMESKGRFLHLSNFLLIEFGVIVCETNVVFTHLSIIHIVKVGSY